MSELSRFVSAETLARTLGQREKPMNGDGADLTTPSAPLRKGPDLNDESTPKNTGAAQTS